MDRYFLPSISSGVAERLCFVVHFSWSIGRSAAACSSFKILSTTSSISLSDRVSCISLSTCDSIAKSLQFYFGFVDVTVNSMWTTSSLPKQWELTRFLVHVRPSLIEDLCISSSIKVNLGPLELKNGTILSIFSGDLLQLRSDRNGGVFGIYVAICGSCS